MRFPALLILLGMAVFSAAAARGEEEWKKIDTGWFSFSAPASFKKVEVKGIDSFVGRYVADGISLDFDYSLYSHGFSERSKENKSESLKVDGFDARTGTSEEKAGSEFGFSTYITIHVDGGYALGMSVKCKTKKEVAMARKIFESIRFPKK